jgi:hypothetical protein
MSKWVSILVTLYGIETKLLKVALKLDKDKLPTDFNEYYLEYTHIIQENLPLHCREYEIVDVEFIFEVEDKSK